jgi:hypothetical protein
LLVNKAAGFGLVEVKVAGGLGGRHYEGGSGFLGLRGSLGLLGGKAGREGVFLRLGLRGHGFPEGLLVLGGAESGFERFELEGFLVMGGFVIG